MCTGLCSVARKAKAGELARQLGVRLRLPDLHASDSAAIWHCDVVQEPPAGWSAAVPCLQGLALQLFQQVEAVMGPAELDITDEAAQGDLMAAAIHQLRTGTPSTLVRPCIQLPMVR